MSRIDMIRNKYKVGQTIELLDDVQNESSLIKGLKGKVLYVNDLGDIEVEWENGSSLSLIYGVDSFKLVNELEKFSKEAILKSMENELKKEKFVSLNFENVDGLKEFMKSYVKAFKEAEFSKEQLTILSEKGEFVLEDMFSHMQNGKYPNDLIEYLNNQKTFDENVEVSTSIKAVVNDFVDDVVKLHFGSLLYDKASKEFQKRYDTICDMSGDEAIKNAYEIVFKSDLLLCFEDCDFLEIEQVKDLLKLEDPLGSCYMEWLDNDRSHMEDLRDTISETANRYSSEDEIEKIEYKGSNNEIGLDM